MSKSVREKQLKRLEKQYQQQRAELQKMQNNHIADNISIQGYSHKIIDKECQDNSLFWKGLNYSGIIVCDGHGGDKYIRSAIGSKIACTVGKLMVSEYMEKTAKDIYNKTNHQIDDDLTRIERSIISTWNEWVEKHYNENPIKVDKRFEELTDKDKEALTKNPVKAYGSTFIVAVMSKELCFILKLGDGNATVLFSDDSAEMPEELADEDLQFNVTTSLCNSDAAISFRHYFRRKDNEKKVTGIVLTSDGIINCYKTEEAYSSFIRNVFEAYGEDDIEIAHSELEEALNSLSEKGSGDDLSVAIVRNKG